MVRSRAEIASAKPQSFRAVNLLSALPFDDP